jgi:hypothetical protein
MVQERRNSTGIIGSKAPSVIAIAGGVLVSERPVPYALFDCDKQVGETLPTEADVWKQALEAGLISDLPVADEASGQVLPVGYHVKEIREEHCKPDPRWRLPDEIS